MTITSTAFQDNDLIPKEYGYHGDNKNPPLTFSEIPDGTKSLVLVMDDPDAQGGTFTHWTIYNMSPATLQIPEGGMPPTGKVAVNSFGQAAYGGPAPPAGTHRYFFKLYALDTVLKDIPPEAKFDVITDILDEHVIDQVQLMGRYSAEA